MNYKFISVAMKARLRTRLRTNQNAFSPHPVWTCNPWTKKLKSDLVNRLIVPHNEHNPFIYFPKSAVLVNHFAQDLQAQRGPSVRFLLYSPSLLWQLYRFDHGGKQST
jgi:hypothetical protein